MSPHKPDARDDASMCCLLLLEQVPGNLVAQNNTNLVLIVWRPEVSNASMGLRFFPREHQEENFCSL